MTANPNYVDLDDALSEPWHAPDLSYFSDGRRAAPAFPLAQLGPFWADWLERNARAVSSPVDYTAVALLAAAGAVIGNVRWAQAGATWAEPSVLWCGLVGSPSSGKSSGADPVSDLLRHIEHRQAADFDEMWRAYETARQAAEARREAWEADVKGAIKAGEPPPSLPPDAVIPNPPVRPRVRVADTTMEKLPHLAAALPRGLVLHRDELAGFLGSFDRYRSGSADRPFALEMYGGRSYTVDRVKSPEPIRIRHLSVGILGGIQPDKLTSLLKGPDDGLISRFLWAWPEGAPAFTLVREPNDDRAAREAFAKLADLAMGSDEFGHPEPKRLLLDPSAEDAFQDFVNATRRRANEETGVLAGSLGKAGGHALRLAAIITHLWWSGDLGGPEPGVISRPAVEAAIKLMKEYFIPMAERVLGDASIPLPEQAAMVLARHLRCEHLTIFNARTLHRKIGGLLRERANMAAACELLVEAGLIRLRLTRKGETAGRKSVDYEVNPAVSASAG